MAMSSTTTQPSRTSSSALYWGIAAAVVAVLAILYAIGTSRSPSGVSNSNAITPPTDSMMTDTPPTTVPPTTMPPTGADGTSR